MKNMFSRVSKLFSTRSSRERYLSEAVDLADLEFRAKQWDNIELERSRNFQKFYF